MKQNGFREVIKAFGSILCAGLLLVNMSPTVRQIRDLPSDIYVDEDSPGFPLTVSGTLFSVTDESGTAVSGDLSETLADQYKNGTKEYVIELFDIPIKRIRIHARVKSHVIPGGIPIGISMNTEGVLVVGLGSIDTEDGRTSPAASAGIKAGDVLLRVDGVEIEGSDHLSSLMQTKDGGSFRIDVLRDDTLFAVKVTPAKDLSDGTLRSGMWVRESTAGIGTLTYILPESSEFGALGHAVTDTDTGERLLIKKGELIRASIVGVSVGQQGSPGELRGTFNSFSERMGRIEQNTPCGVFGTVYEYVGNPLYPDGLPIAYAQEVKEGKAAILSSVDPEGIKQYECEIVKLYPQHETNTKGIVLRITDEALLEKTGGIVQGMSGSPIIQDGKLIGAVTHVFVNDPARGYGIFIENMLDAAG